MVRLPQGGEFYREKQASQRPIPRSSTSGWGNCVAGGRRAAVTNSAGHSGGIAAAFSLVFAITYVFYWTNNASHVMLSSYSRVSSARTVSDPDVNRGSGRAGRGRIEVVATWSPTHARKGYHPARPNLFLSASTARHRKAAVLRAGPRDRKSSRRDALPGAIPALSR